MHVALEGNTIKTVPELELNRNLIFGVKGLISQKKFWWSPAEHWRKKLLHWSEWITGHIYRCDISRQNFTMNRIKFQNIFVNIRKMPKISLLAFLSAMQIVELEVNLILCWKNSEYNAFREHIAMNFLPALITSVKCLKMSQEVFSWQIFWWKVLKS